MFVETAAQIGYNRQAEKDGPAALCGREDDAELAAQGDLLADELRRLFTRYVEDCAFA